jgi:hypothetical protein
MVARLLPGRRFHISIAATGYKTGVLGGSVAVTTAGRHYQQQGDDDRRETYVPLDHYKPPFG